MSEKLNMDEVKQYRIVMHGALERSAHGANYDLFKTYYARLHAAAQDDAAERDLCLGWINRCWKLMHAYEQEALLEELGLERE